MTIGQHINMARLKKGYTIKRLAEESFISVNTIIYWIYHGACPSVDLLICVADTLGVTLDELVGRQVTHE